MRYTNGQHPAASMVASYGVYNDSDYRETSYSDPYRTDRDREEDGFIPRSNQCRGVVVNASGDSSVVRPSRLQQSPQHAASNSRCGWCLTKDATAQPSSSSASCWISWCRPTILLLVLVLLVVVFVLVSGILLYHNCTTAHVQQRILLDFLVQVHYPAAGADTPGGGVCPSLRHTTLSQLYVCQIVVAGYVEIVHRLAV
ncbi:unnamed protein product [Phaedon cochleariae]|uniref:Uncharacterized protein n=1 Tax=Phaedon cochleariae TaxID=80249 RepID=A0A9N9SER2_PHACE|nr:unnamed protein product [Phaedon cochleariae]